MEVKWNEQYGEVQFGRLLRGGTLMWQITFEVPLPSQGKETTVFHADGYATLGRNHPLTEAEEYRLAIKQIADRMDEFSRWANELWQEPQKED